MVVQHELASESSVARLSPELHRHHPGAAGLGWVGLSLVLTGIAVTALVPLLLDNPAADAAATRVGYVTLLTGSVVALAGVAFDRARRAGVAGLLIGFLAYLTLSLAMAG